MNNEMKFRATLGGGYKKEDVNNYIATMQAQFMGIEETLKNTINHQKAELDALRIEASAAQELQNAYNAQKDTLGSVQAQLEGVQIEAEQLRAQLSESQSALSDLRTRYAALDDENTALNAQLQAMKTEATLSAEREQAKAAPSPAVAQQAEAPAPAAEHNPVYPDDYKELKHKAEQYDRMSAQVGAIILKANTTAEEIVRQAREEAENLLAGVNAELSATRKRLLTDADTLIDSVNTRIASINSSCCEDIYVDIEEIRGALSVMMDAVQTKCADINQKLSHTKEEMDTSAKEMVHRATAARVLKK